MGYETKLIIGQLTNITGFKNKDCKMVMEIASIDLCKSCFYDTWIDKDEDIEKVYIYDTKGDEEITKDRYGSQLVAVNPDKVLKMMQDANKPKYRRYEAAIPLLKALIKGFDQDGLTCVLYGY